MMKMLSSMNILQTRKVNGLAEKNRYNCDRHLKHMNSKLGNSCYISREESRTYFLLQYFAKILKSAQFV